MTSYGIVISAATFGYCKTNIPVQMKSKEIFPLFFPEKLAPLLTIFRRSDFFFQLKCVKTPFTTKKRCKQLSFLSNFYLFFKPSSVPTPVRCSAPVSAVSSSFPLHNNFFQQTSTDYLWVQGSEPGTMIRRHLSLKSLSFSEGKTRLIMWHVQMKRMLPALPSGSILREVMGKSSIGNRIDCEG